MAQAKDKLHYVMSWESHVNQLSGIAWALSDRDDGSYERLHEIQKELKELIKKAADQDFKGE